MADEKTKLPEGSVNYVLTDDMLARLASHIASALRPEPVGHAGVDSPAVRDYRDLGRLMGRAEAGFRPEVTAEVDEVNGKVTLRSVPAGAAALRYIPAKGGEMRHKTITTKDKSGDDVIIELRSAHEIIDLTDAGGNVLATIRMVTTHMGEAS